MRARGSGRAGSLGEALLGAGLSLALGWLAACHKDPPPQSSAPTPQQEAAALLEQARRDVEQAPPEAKPSAPALQVP